jgi:hypothetical protein
VKSPLKPAARRPALVGVVLTSTLLLSACASGAASSDNASATLADSISVGSSLSLASLNPFESQRRRPAWRRAGKTRTT